MKHVFFSLLVTLLTASAHATDANLCQSLAPKSQKIRITCEATDNNALFDVVFERVGDVCLPADRNVPNNQYKLVNGSLIRDGNYDKIGILKNGTCTLNLRPRALLAGFALHGTSICNAVGAAVRDGTMIFATETLSFGYQATGLDIAVKFGSSRQDENYNCTVSEIKN